MSTFKIKINFFRFSQQPPKSNLFDSHHSLDIPDSNSKIVPKVVQEIDHKFVQKDSEERHTYRDDNLNEKTERERDELLYKENVIETGKG